MNKIAALAVLGLGVVLAAGFLLRPTVAETSIATAGATGAATADMTALTSSRDSTIARRLMMNSIGSNNDIVHDMLDGVLPMDDLEIRNRLSSISAMLYAFANLYRAAPNPYSEAGEKADAYGVSLAKANVWSEFDLVRDQAYAAFYKAQEAADSTPEHMLQYVEELEVMCEGCHETYRTEFTYVDFDNIDGMLK